MNTPVWEPSKERVERSNMSAFRLAVNDRRGLHLTDYDALYAWSIDATADFWEDVWTFTQVKHSHPYSAVLREAAMPGAIWFDGARLNFAENLLRYRDEQTAIVWCCENGERQEISYAGLYRAVAQLATFLRAKGIDQGDRVAGFVPNRIESIIAMLAATSIGAIWSSCSPDFGFKGVMDRFGQIQPKVLITADGYHYNGKMHDSLDRAKQVVAAIDSIETVLVIPFLSESPALSDIRGAINWKEALENDATEVDFAQLPFDHPLYIMYSSGTTGVPKCIVHGAGGTLVQHAKELVLHTDLKRDDTIFYFTTCGWMMWNWLVSALMTGSTLVLYDGSPAFPDAAAMWRMAADEAVTVFGTSPKFISLCKQTGQVPKDEHSLSVRTLLSTGAPLSAESFHWILANIGAVQIGSICGGTDIISCFMGGEPTSPVYAGECQKRGLGMAVEAWQGANNPVTEQKGELVCTKPFVSMPIAFWNDKDGSRYHKAYFDHFPGIWRHGDFIEITAHGGVIVYGRSDATLNPGGVRIGTAEIYRQVEAMDQIVDSIVVGQIVADDTRIVLFVVLRPDLSLSDELISQIKRRIRKNTTPRHVPSLILQAPGVPRTISGKRVEIAVTRLIHGEKVGNRDAMANPEVLEYYKGVRLPA